MMLAVRPDGCPKCKSDDVTAYGKIGKFNAFICHECGYRYAT